MPKWLRTTLKSNFNRLCKQLSTTLPTEHEHGHSFDPPRARALTQRVCGLDRWFKALDAQPIKNASGLKALRIFGWFGFLQKCFWNSYILGALNLCGSRLSMQCRKRSVPVGARIKQLVPLLLH